MSLRPFHIEGTCRFFFASPETCAAHVARDWFGPGDYVLVINDWYVPDHPTGVEAYRQLAATRFRRLRILCNSREEQAILNHDFGFPDALTLYCPRHFSHGLSRATRMLRPAAAPGRPRFDAVLNARSRPYKNHWAAVDVDNLAVIDMLGAKPEIACRYHNRAPLDLTAVAGVLQQSGVGLALSFIEGACLASLEYLLCGLPVVSTHSRGGRDTWYDDENCIRVGPEDACTRQGACDRRGLCEEVAAAVRHWCDKLEAGQVDSARIRARALAVNRRFARRLGREIQRITGDDTGGEAPRNDLRWLPALQPYYAYGAHAR